jgi:purine-binding chemotaxis protein CheW
MTTLYRTAAGEIDWTAVHGRLAEHEAALRTAAEPSPEQAREILDARARWLARVPQGSSRPEDLLDVVTFQLGGERYGVETSCVRKVERPGAVVPVPGTPPLLLGVVNLRGSLLPVFDLCRLFGLATPPVTPSSRLLVLGKDEDEFGVVADTVLAVTTVRAGELLEPPDGTAGGGHARGITADGTVVLDGDRLLGDPRLFIDGGTP